jgi:hypothetical protein
VDEQVAGCYLVDDIEIAPVVDLVDDAPYLRLVLLRHWCAPSPIHDETTPADPAVLRWNHPISRKRRHG